MKFTSRLASAAFASAAVFAAPLAARAETGGLEIRFCPSAQVRPYPLESKREVQSVVLHDIAVLNAGPAPVEITMVEIDLMRGGEAVDFRRLGAPDLAQAAKQSAALAQAGAMRLFPAQFCGDALLTGGYALGGTTLQPKQALFVMQELLAYSGQRDMVRLRVTGRSNGREVRGEASLPIRPGMSKTVFRFPMTGVWWAGVGATPHTGHRWVVPEAFALDIARLGGDGLDHRGSGEAFKDYYAYGADVLAAADGKVIQAVDGVAEDPASLRRANEGFDAYSKRFVERQAALLQQGERALAGNYVVIDHGNGEFSFYAHMQQGSVRVKPGQTVKAGEVLGLLGSSGNSTAPHLHFQVCDAPGPLLCAGIPINFKYIELPWADYERPIQSGDVVLAR